MHFLVAFFFLFPGAGPGAPAGKAARTAESPPSHDRVMAALRADGLARLGAFDFLSGILSCGPRPAGSDNAARAVEKTRSVMQEIGLADVHLEEVTVTLWERGPGSAAAVLADGTEEPLAAAALGSSVPTPDGGITAPVVEVRSLEEARALGEKGRGRIVFFNRAMPTDVLDTFEAYGKAADQRAHGASAAAASGAVAVLVRSMTLRVSDLSHTGIMAYDEGVPRIPAAAISTAAADRLSSLLAQGAEVRVRLELGCRTVGPVTSHNVVGDLRGRELPAEVVVLGGHLDSWDLGPGAHDDGAGCAQSLEALRLLAALPTPPRRTIRAVMFMDEESGGTGGKAYASNPKRKSEKHVAAIESDRGGFLPLGFTVLADEPTIAAFNRWLPLLKDLGVTFIRKGYGGVDIHPLVESGCVTIGLYPDSQRYFDVHHCAADTLDTVNERELELGAIQMAGLAWLIAEEGIPR
ncbi:MAG: M20/M25/M40 family metallo-hydrolase [Deltaproteobacteria bacterium]|nr:M20/M25/M40 family metallo-hydrolase [Deltaproteobacteria bacterium]